MATPALANQVRLDVGASGDLDDVIEIMEAAFGSKYGEAWTRSQCAGILPMAGVSLMLARDGDTGEAVGFSLSRSVADEAELLLLAVLPGRHRQGIGSRLLEDFMRRAGTVGAARVHLEVRDGNPAVTMYRDAGFAPVGRRRNYYQATDGRRYDALTFARNL
jgi:[ribosomal protein S18]-alanine N-acetyltransferase